MKSDAVTIRNVVEDDVPLILTLILELAEYEKLRHQVVADEETLREMMFRRGHADAVIADVKGETAGFALFFYNFSTFVGRPGLYLEDLYVRPAFRARGIGKQLLSHLARIAIERGCGRMEWAVLDWNEPAIGFYRSLGAAPVSEWTVFRLTGEPLRRLSGEAREKRSGNPGDTV